MKPFSISLKKKRCLKASILLLELLILLCPLLATNIFDSPLVQAATSITSSNYAGYQAVSVADALDDAETFLNSQKTLLNPARPYQNNSDWSEGSLMGLAQAVAAVKALPTPETEAAKDSCRWLLVKNIRQLEEKTAQSSPISLSLLNNYPDAMGNYSAEISYSKGLKNSSYVYDLYFVLDWSSSMGQGMGTWNSSTGDFDIPNSRLDAAKLIQRLTTEAIEGDYPGSRVGISGLNTGRTNSGGPVFDDSTMIDFMGPPLDTISATRDAINQAFTVAPSHTGDDNSAFVNFAINKLTDRKDQSRIPVVVHISDWQINMDKWNYSLAREQYLYASVKDLKSKFPDVIYLAVFYAHSSDDSGFTSKFPANFIPLGGIDANSEYRWGCMSIVPPNRHNRPPYIDDPNDPNQNNYESREDRIAALLHDKAPRPNYGYHLTDETENYFVKDPTNPSNTVTGGAIEQSQSDALTVTFSDNQQQTDLEGLYVLKADLTKLNDSGVATEKKYPISQSVEVNYTSTEFTAEKETLPANQIPQAKLPVTHASIEYYTYAGDTQGGAKANPKNYKLSTVIAGENIKDFGSTSPYTFYQDADLTNLPYLGSLTTELNYSLCQPILEKYIPKPNLTTELSASEAPKAVQFDVGENVFRFYGEQDIKKVNIRQVVLNSNSEIIVPHNGYTVLNQLVDASQPTVISSTLPALITSTDKGDTNITKASFSRHAFSFVTGAAYLQLNPIIPSMYSYVGYIASKDATNLATDHLSTNPWAGVAPSLPVLDYRASADQEQWVTIFLKPSDSSPPFYDADYKMNQFNKVT